MPRAPRRPCPELRPAGPAPSFARPVGDAPRLALCSALRLVLSFRATSFALRASLLRMFHVKHSRPCPTRPRPTRPCPAGAAPPRACLFARLPPSPASLPPLPSAPSLPPTPPEPAFLLRPPPLPRSPRYDVSRETFVCFCSRLHLRLRFRSPPSPPVPRLCRSPLSRPSGARPSACLPLPLARPSLTPHLPAPRFPEPRPASPRPAPVPLPSSLRPSSHFLNDYPGTS